MHIFRWNKDLGRCDSLPITGKVSVAFDLQERDMTAAEAVAGDCETKRSRMQTFVPAKGNCKGR